MVMKAVASTIIISIKKLVCNVISFYCTVVTSMLLMSAGIMFMLFAPTLLLLVFLQTATGSRCWCGNQKQQPGDPLECKYMSHRSFTDDIYCWIFGFCFVVLFYVVSISFAKYEYMVRLKWCEHLFVFPVLPWSDQLHMDGPQSQQTTQGFCC